MYVRWSSVRASRSDSKTRKGRKEGKERNVYVPLKGGGFLGFNSSFAPALSAFLTLSSVTLLAPIAAINA